MDNKQCTMDIAVPRRPDAQAGNDQRANAIFECAEGLTRAEWRRIVEMVDRKFDEAANRVTITRQEIDRMKELYRVER